MIKTDRVFTTKDVNAWENRSDVYHDLNVRAYTLLMEKLGNIERETLSVARGSAGITGRSMGSYLYLRDTLYGISRRHEYDAMCAATRECVSGSDAGRIGIGRCITLTWKNSTELVSFRAWVYGDDREPCGNRPRVYSPSGRSLIDIMRWRDRMSCQYDRNSVDVDGMWAGGTYTKDGVLGISKGIVRLRSDGLYHARIPRSTKRYAAGRSDFEQAWYDYKHIVYCHKHNLPYGDISVVNTSGKVMRK